MIAALYRVIAVKINREDDAYSPLVLLGIRYNCVLYYYKC
jgi:hypothetical protein